MTRHATSRIPPAMQCTQRLDSALLDELIVETRTIEELDLDTAKVAPLLVIDLHTPPMRINVDDIEIVEETPE